jgi:hypothetical protein
MIREMFPRISDDPVEAEAALVSSIPHGRMGTAGELAETGVWLLLDAPAHLSGQCSMSTAPAWRADPDAEGISGVRRQEDLHRLAGRPHIGKGTAVLGQRCDPGRQ